MAMKMGEAASSPDAYVEALSGWQRKCVESLRAAIHAGSAFQESIKWTNLLFSSNGQCIVIRAEEERVILGFFRGKRLAHIDARLKPSGKYELANIVFREGDNIDVSRVTDLARHAAELNAELGDPTARS